MSIIATTHHESRLYRHRHSHDHVILTIIMLRGLIVSVVILSLALAFFSLVHTVILLISTAPPPRTVYPKSSLQSYVERAGGEHKP